MDNKILELLNQLLDGQKDTTQRLDKIENRIDNVVDQAAQLNEFRAETKESLNKIIVEVEEIEEIKEIKSDLNNVEAITASNWKDIAKLKSVK